MKDCDFHIEQVTLVLRWQQTFIRLGIARLRKMVPVLVLTSALFCALPEAVFAQGLADSPWPRGSGNNKSQRRSDYIGPTSNVMIIWHDKTERNWQVPLVDSNGVLYTPLYWGDNHGVAARNPEGDILWHLVDPQVQPSSGALTTNGKLFLRGYKLNFIAVTTDGQKLWSLSLPMKPQVPAIGEDGTIYTAGFQHVYALNPDGSIKWHELVLVNDTAPWLTVPALSDDGTIYLSDYQDRWSFAYNPDGTQKWVQTSVGGPGPALSDDCSTVYISSGSGLFALDSEDGDIRWHFTDEDFAGTESAPAVAHDGTIHVGSSSGYFFAVNPDGSLRWKRFMEKNALSALYTPLVDAAGNCFFGSILTEGGKFFALDSEGELLWSLNIGGLWCRMPSMDGDGTLYLASQNGGLAAVVSAMPVPMKFTPQVLNLGSKGKWVKAHLVLPEGFSVEDVDVNTPAKIKHLGIKSEHINVFANEEGLVEIEIAFDRAAFRDAAIDDAPVDIDSGAIEVVVVCRLISGQYIYGTKILRIMNNKLVSLAVFGPSLSYRRAMLWRLM